MIPSRVREVPGVKAVISGLAPAPHFLNTTGFVADEYQEGEQVKLISPPPALVKVSV